MTIEVFEITPVKPRHIAIQIPSKCTMSDADAIEILSHGVIERHRWSAADNSVYMFIVHGKVKNYDSYASIETDTVKPEQWVVCKEVVDIHDSRQRTYSIMTNSQYHRMYNTK